MSHFDWKNPDYTPIFMRRIEVLEQLRADPKMLAAFKLHYREHPDDFINDWGVTFDPRNIEKGLPSVVPFLLFPKQREWIQFVMRKWRNGEPGLTEKSRDMGLSWLAVSLGCALCIFNEGFIAGYGSRKEEYVDKLDGPKSLFYKARMFMRHLPPEFSAGWNEKKHAPHMRLVFPATGSAMTGEAGDGIGRGDRTSLYMVDEAAFLERPLLVDASLSQTTNCRQDLSSVNGRDNPFAEKAHAGKIEKFIFDWRDDPRKDQAWYDNQCDILDPVIVAQEIDRNYSASKEGIVIPNEWIQSAIDAHVVLGIEPTGDRMGSLDVADEGRDLNAFAGKHGIVLETLDEWSGKGADVFETVARVFIKCDEYRCSVFRFDSDGLGVGVRGDARVLNDARLLSKQSEIEAIPFRGSGAVVDPDGQVKTANTDDRHQNERLNKDTYQNAKAQAWFALRLRFQLTHRAVQAQLAGKPIPFDADELISISSACPLLTKLTAELTQPTWSPNNTGKIVIDKAPDGSRSPNVADSVMILYAPQLIRRGFFDL